jgi:nitrite reductase/ring-hydroxylating ferredoxin subunit
VNAPDAEDWSEVGALADLDPEYPSMATVRGTEVALCRYGEQVFAVGNLCTHAFARLSDGFLVGTEIVCPLHQGSFDFRTGEPVNPPCDEAIAAYAVAVESGRVFVDVSRPPSRAAEIACAARGEAE